jgi:hypothetical protein
MSVIWATIFSAITLLLLLNALHLYLITKPDPNPVDIIKDGGELLVEILNEHQKIIGKDYVGYSHHCYRMFHFVTLITKKRLGVSKLNPEILEKFAIAAAFHDIGIWTEDKLVPTVAYIEPSIERAKIWLQRKGKEIDSIILDMIGDHHKITRATSNPLVEDFRQADLIDFSLGFITFDGISRPIIRATQLQYPNEGFHKRLVELGIYQLTHDPLNPLPMMRW